MELKEEKKEKNEDNKDEQIQKEDDQKDQNNNKDTDEEFLSTMRDIIGLKQRVKLPDFPINKKIQNKFLKEFTKKKPKLKILIIYQKINKKRYQKLNIHLV